MLQKDIDALNARFWSVPLSYTDRDGQTVELLGTQVLVENQPDEDIDDTKPWARWIINPGLSKPTTLGLNPTITQWGTATLQIFVPKGLYTGPGNDLRDKFNKLFRGWRSAEKKVLVDDLTSRSSTYTKGKSEFHLINAMFSWHSNRRATDV